MSNAGIETTRRTPATGKAVGPTRQEAADIAAGKGRKSAEINEKIGRSRWARGLLITAASLGGAAVVVGGYEAYENVPAIHERVDSLLGRDTMIHKKSDINIDSIYSDSIHYAGIEKGSISRNNVVDITSGTQEDLPSFDEKGQPLLLFPISNLKPGESIAYVKGLNRTAWPQDIIDKATKEGIREFVNLQNVPVGKEFRAPIDGRVFIMQVERNGEFIPIGITIEFMSSDNILYFLNMAVNFPKGTDFQKALNILVQAPLKGPENSQGKQWEKGLLVKRNDPLFTTTQQIGIGMLLQGGTNGSLYNPRIPGNIAFR